MDVSLGGKFAVVCGASRGLGRACAETLAHAGADLVVVSRDKAELARTAAQIARETNPDTVLSHFFGIYEIQNSCLNFNEPFGEIRAIIFPKVNETPINGAEQGKAAGRLPKAQSLLQRLPWNACGKEDTWQC